MKNESLTPSPSPLRLPRTGERKERGDVDFLSQLSEPQRKAVKYVEGPSLVVAGAGSGKTRVLTYKIAYLLSLGCEPWRIIALTFTNKAATEMRERIATLIGPERARSLWMGTFHSLFLRILRQQCDHLPFTPNFTIYDEKDSQSLVKSIIKELHLPEEFYKPSGVLQEISKAKAALIDARAYAANKELRQADARSQRPAIADIYRQYAERCLRANAMDFDDILLFTHRLFAAHEEVRQLYAQRFRFVLVDEYQDTNYAQHEIVWQLARERQRLCVVGDDAQSIYSFRGARIDNILQFTKRYTGGKLFKLEQNYRSTQMIVNAANSLIHKNTDQIDKHVFSTNAVGKPVAFNKTSSDIEERNLVVSKISRLHGRDHVSYSEMAILYRTHAQSRVFEEALLKQHIPYRIYGGLSFYQRKEIKDVVAYLRLAVNPHDDEALRRVINEPKRGLGDVTLQKIIDLANVHQVSLFTVISQPNEYGLTLPPKASGKVQAFVQMLTQCGAQAANEPAILVGRELLQRSGLERSLRLDTSAEGQDRLGNVEELLGGMTDFCQRHAEDGHYLLSDYLSEISLLTTQDRPQGEEAAASECVTLMTVHAAKGLEFDIVFIVGMEQGLFPNDRSMSSSAALQEERRLFYVALTRARLECHISCAASRYRNGQYSCSEPSMFIDDIDEQYMSFPSTAQSSSFPSLSPLPRRGRDPWNGGARALRRETKSTPTRPIHDRFGMGGSSAFRPIEGSRRRNEMGESAANSSPSMPTPATSAPAALPTKPIRIRHDRFGIGTIIASQGEGAARKITVDFDTCGRKQLLVKFAKIQLLS